MAKVAPDTFDKQLTSTLRLKGVKKMSDLVQHYKSVADAVNGVSGEGFAEFGQENYDKAKNLTLRFKKRDKEYDELKKLWKEYEQHVSENGPETAGALNVPESLSHSSSTGQLPLHEPTQLEIMLAVAQKKDISDEELPDNIETDKDLAVVLLAMIQESFYNPEKGLWPKYDPAFVRDDFTKHGKPGWENDKPNGASRDAINRKKNEEIQKIMDSKFVHDVSSGVLLTVGYC
jgi:hypothetical protein